MLLYSFDVDTLFIQNGYIVVKSQKEYVRHTHYFNHVINIKTERSAVFVSDNFNKNKKKAVNTDELKKNILFFIENATKKLFEAPPLASQEIQRAFKITLSTGGWRYENDFFKLVLNGNYDKNAEKQLNNVADLYSNLKYAVIEEIVLWNQIKLTIQEKKIILNAENEIERLSLSFDGGDDFWYIFIDIHIFAADKVLIVANTINESIDAKKKIQKQFKLDYDGGGFDNGYYTSTDWIDNNIQSVDVLYP